MFVLVLVFLSLARPTHAAFKEYSGAFIGVSLAAGPNVLRGENSGAAVGFSTQLEGRFASVLQLVDLSTFYAFSTTRFSYAGADNRFTGHGLGMAAALHPAFLSHLGNRTWNYIMGSIHMAFGFTGEWRSISGGLGADQFAFGWHWALGFDVPLQNPNNGQSFWLGFRYTRWNRDFSPAGDVRDQDAHAFTLRFEHRWNAFPGF